MTNFHTHVARCGHATGTEEDYVLEAIEKGFTQLGFSDHGPSPDDSLACRMSWEEKEDYIAAVSEMKKKYSDKITIYTGFEYEYKKKFDKAFLREVHDRPDVDYFALGVHIFDDDAGNELSAFGRVEPDEYKYYVRALEQAADSGLFFFLAHPDLIFMHMTEHCRQADEAIDAIVKIAVEHDLPMEINANGMRRPLLNMTDGTQRFTYPYRPFWDKAAEMGARAIVGSDCHAVADLCDDKFHLAYQLAKEWGIEVKPLSGEEL